MLGRLREELKKLQSGMVEGQSIKIRVLMALRQKDTERDTEVREND